MKLQEVFSISGKPGLFTIVSGNKQPFIVEQLDATKKRLPIFAKDRIVSLADISIYTLEADVPLGEVLQEIFDRLKGAEINEAEVSKSGETLHTFMSSHYPSYDPDRVHNGDIKKLVKWYNLLVQNGMTSFIVTEEKEEEKES